MGALSAAAMSASEEREEVDGARHGRLERPGLAGGTKGADRLRKPGPSMRFQASQDTTKDSADRASIARPRGR
jgi:hypothetical protein